MELYLVRHAEAIRLGEQGVTEDEERTLTKKGEEQARKVGAGLAGRGVKPEVILASPLVRARQTAELLAAKWPKAPELQVCPALAPGRKRRKLARVVNDLAREHVVLVGHEPDLGAWAGWLIGGKKARIELPKAGVAYLHCPYGVEKGGGTLIWLVPPEWLG